MTKEEFLERARAKHGDKYTYVDLPDEFVAKSTTIKAICPKHGLFEQNARTHYRQSGCRECGNEKALEASKDDTDIFIIKAKSVHGDKYDYSRVNYVDNDTPVEIICPIHGVFKKTPHDHKRGKGCPHCSRESAGEKRKMTFEEFHERAVEIWGDAYDYSKVDLDNRDEKGRVCVICPKHGEFFVKPERHIFKKNPRGCRECGYERNGDTFRKSFEDFVKDARVIHGDKYIYDDFVYVNSGTKGNIICPIHGPFPMTPNAHLSQRQGCPVCACSKLELEVMNFLDKNGVKYIHECDKDTFQWLDKQHLDIYLPDYNVAIECQGDQHFYPVDIFGGEEGFVHRQELDEEKKKKCDEHGIKLYYFTKSDFDELLGEIVYHDVDELLTEIKK